MSPSILYLTLTLEALGLVFFLGGYVLGYRSGYDSYDRALQWCAELNKESEQETKA